MKRFSMYVLLSLLAIGLISSSAMAKSDWKMISTKELKAKIDGGGSGKDFYLIDARTNVEYKISHIPTAISVPANKVAASTIMPKDKNALLIFYCNGPKCTKSKKAAENAMGIGYTNILIYDDGLPDWQKSLLKVQVDIPMKQVDIDSISVTDLKGLLEANDSSYVFLDVRDKDEFKSRKVDGFTSIPLDDLLTEYKNIDPNKNVILFDHIGKQVKQAGWVLNHYGFKNIKKVNGGILEWMKKGYPVSASGK